MCCEKFLIYPRCGHPQSAMGTIYHCPSYPSRGRTCVNSHGQTYKDFEFIIEDTRTKRYVEGLEHPIPGGWKAEVANGYKGYCNNCLKGRSEPRTLREREEFVNEYLGEHERWESEKGKRSKLVREQERLMEKLKREKGRTETWD